MLGAAGMIIPEILAAGGLIPQTSDEVAWFKTGVIPPAGNYGRFWADPYALFFIEVIAFQFAELRRWQDYKKPGSMGKQYFLGFEKVLGGSGNPSYPGMPSWNHQNVSAAHHVSSLDMTMSLQCSFRCLGPAPRVVLCGMTSMVIVANSLCMYANAIANPKAAGVPYAAMLVCNCVLQCLAISFLALNLS